MNELYMATQLNYMRFWMACFG